MNRSTRLWAATAMLLVVPSVACSRSGGSEGKSVEESLPIALQGIAFVPAQVTVERGSSVTWTDREDVEHTVTAGTPEDPEPARFDKILNGGEMFTFTFGERETYAFFCRRHPANMKGAVIVR